MATRMFRAQAMEPALVGTLGLETNRAPLPQAAAGRACIAHSRACTSVSRQSSSTRCRPTAPGISLQFLSFHLSSLLCRAVLYYPVSTSAIPQRLLSAQFPCCCGTYTSLSPLFASKFRLSSYACRRAPVLRSPTPTPPRHSNTIAQMPGRQFGVISI